MTTKATIKRFGSLFFLGIFLWFYSVKDIHDAVHGDDIHCHVKNAKHIHQAEHHCPICDVLLPYFDEQKLNIEIPSVQFFSTVERYYAVQGFLAEPISLFSSRGPPVVA